MRLLLFNDPHFSFQSPISRNEHYAKDILRKLSEVIILASKTSSDYLICSGDIFHRKSSTSFYESNIIMKLFKRSRVPIYGIAGSHDMNGYEFSSVYRKAAGSLFTAECIKPLDVYPIESEGILVTGTSYHRMYDISRSAYCKPEQYIDKYVISITHGSLILSDSGTFFGNYTNMNDLRNLKFGVLSNVIFNGHMHAPQKQYKFNDKDCTVFNVGSLARNIYKEDVAKRKPCVMLMDIKEGSFKSELIELKNVKDFKEAFIARDIKTLEDDSSIKDFVNALINESGELSSTSEKDLIYKVITQYGYDEAIHSRVLSYIESEE